MWRKFDGAVKLIMLGGDMNAKALHGAYINFTDTGVLHLLSPNSRRLFSVRQYVGSINDQKRFAIYANVAAVFKGREQTPNEVAVVLVGIPLRDQGFILAAVPATGPVLISPAETKGEI